ncbi:MAG: hypothetical protein WC335_03250 [Candidatus Omnitrophota bacterium]|jgi:hypothetical protein
MRKVTLFILIILLGWAGVLYSAADQGPRNKVILLISEQNIEGPKAAWWASEVDLSAGEAAIAKKLLEEGYRVLEPSAVDQVVKKDKAFRMVDIGEGQSIELAKLAKADFVVTGKAVASAGGLVPSSNMRSCFGNLTVKVISVKDGEVAAYLDAAGSSVHTDVITGGKEALIRAAESMAQKIADVLNKKQKEDK